MLTSHVSKLQLSTMRSAIRSVLPLNLHLLLSLVGATQLPTQRGLRWLNERTVFVRVDIPNLPLWNADEQIGENLPSAFIFNFTLSHDNRMLILNDIPILPPENAYVPPRLYAPQSSETLVQFENATLTDYKNCPLFSLDYSLFVSEAGDSTQTVYNYNASLDLDILGAGIAGYNTLLPSNDQRFIRLTLNQVEPFSTPISLVAFEIADIHLEYRGSNYQFKTPDDLKPCTMWSWLCPDKSRYPWYQYIYRQNFDEYGKIGSMRHLIHMRWANLLERNGVVQVGVICFIIGGVILSFLGYGVYRVWRRAEELWQCKGRNMDAWTADEEIGGLLDDEEEDEEEDNRAGMDVVEMEDWTGSADAELRHKPLPPPPVPPPVPPKAGESSRL
jgi:hypothetical protein